MVVRVAPVVGEPVMAKRTSCPGWDVLDPDARTVGLHDQPRHAETESHAAFAARFWRTARARRIEFEGALSKGGPIFGESEFFGLVEHSDEAKRSATVQACRPGGGQTRESRIVGNPEQLFF